MLNGFGFWSPEVHYAVTALHIFAGVFWLGWMVFMFAILRPVLRHVAPDRAPHIQTQIQQRIRAIVFWLIPVLLLTGLYNMGYWGLLDLGVLLNTGRGQRMLGKLGAVTVLFGIYYTAPVLLRSSHAELEGHGPVDCHDDSNPLVQRASAVLHILAFTAGVMAAYLGVGLGG